MKSLATVDFAAIVHCLAVAGCGLMAGVFFAFSSFVMKALARLPAETGIAAMQSINVFAVKSWFLVAFLGTAVACGFAIVSAFGRWGESSARWSLGGGVAFLAGTFLVTVVFNIPMNNALAALPTNDPDQSVHWARYVSNWTAWNHVRTISSFAAAALLLVGGFGERKQTPTALAFERQPSAQPVSHDSSARTQDHSLLPRRLM